jgi:hypothetical protein
LEVDKIALVEWMRKAACFSQGEIRSSLGYPEYVDPTQVLVPSGWIPLSDLLSGDLEITDEM